MLEKGTKVRVLGGAFQGRIGVISEVDGKGYARVAFGLMSVRLPVDDLKLAADGPVRTVLRTSHWRPGATTPTKPAPAASGPPPRGRAPTPSATLRSSEPAPSSTRPRSEPPGDGAESGSERSKKPRATRRDRGR